MLAQPCALHCACRTHLGLTHEQLLQLRRVVKDSGTGVQGHSRTPAENARALLHVEEHRRRGMSYDAAVKATAAAELASPSTLRDVTKQFFNTGTLPTAHRAPVSRLDPRHPFC